MHKTESISYQSAINRYYGGVHGLSRQKMPFTCQVCEEQTYPQVNTEGGGHSLPVMDITDCYRHIRRVHKEKIK